MEFHFLYKVLLTSVIVGVLGLFLQLYNSLVRKPERLRSALRKQGITGPKPTFILGNISEIKKARDSAAKAKAKAKAAVDGEGQHPVFHNCGSVLLPFLDQWRKDYGNGDFSFFNLFFTSRY